jgi:hypothetical protein
VLGVDPGDLDLEFTVADSPIDSIPNWSLWPSMTAIICWVGGRAPPQGKPTPP